MPDFDLYTERLIQLGKACAKDMANAEIDKCNCMIRYGSSSSQLPSIRKGKKFFTPQGDEVSKPDSFEDMPPAAIKKIMDERGEVYIGHMFTQWVPKVSV